MRGSCSPVHWPVMMVVVVDVDCSSGDGSVRWAGSVAVYYWGH